MPKYIVAATSHLSLTFNQKGEVTHKDRIPKGGEVTMSEAEAERLVRTGGLVLASDADTEQDSSEAERVQADSAAASAGGVTGGDGEVHPDHLGPEDDADLDTGDDTGDDGDVEPDPYEDMEYADLQQAAKARDLNAGGSTADLQARLREFDAAKAADDSNQ